MKSAEAFDVIVAGVKGNEYSVGEARCGRPTPCARPEAAASRDRKQGSKSNSIVNNHDHEMRGEAETQKVREARTSFVEPRTTKEQSLPTRSAIILL